MVETLTQGRPVAVAVQEAGGRTNEVVLLDRLFADRGYTRVVGAKARYIYAAADAAVVRTGVVTSQRTRMSRVTTLPWAVIDHEGQRLTVASVHLTSADGAAKDLDRLHEVDVLTAALPDGAVALVGDFNSLSHRDTPLDADTHRYRVHEHLMTNGWTSAVPTTSTYIQQPVDERNLGTLSFDRAYFRGLEATATALADHGLSDHLAIRIEVTP